MNVRVEAQSTEHRPARKVTIFGDGSPIDLDLAQQLMARGASTVIVTVPIGWPEAVKFAVARVDTRRYLGTGSSHNRSD